MRIGIVAPSCRLDPALPDALTAITGTRAELVFHSQCFLSEGHFAGSDAARRDALIEMANDPSLDAIWFARGGYGACRIAEPAIGAMGEAARAKKWLGYSDAGFLLAGLYARGIGTVAHGPMPADLKREGGEAAVRRALDWLIDGRADAKPEGGGKSKQAAFNLTVLSQLLGTPLEPSLADHVLMIEEVSEYTYRIDRSLFHVTSNPAIRAVAGIRLGRCGDIPENDTDFGQDEEAVCRYWCERSGIAYLGRADIGHDADNKVVVFGG